MIAVTEMGAENDQCHVNTQPSVMEAQEKWRLQICSRKNPDKRLTVSRRQDIDPKK